MSVNNINKADLTNGLSDLDIELNNKVLLLADEVNQGEVLERKDYLALTFVGIVIPIIISMIAWYLS